MERYRISRQTLNTRINAAKIELILDGRHKKTTPEQLAVLDDLDKHLDNGGTFKNFVPVSSVVVDTPPDTMPDTQVDIKLDTISQEFDIEETNVRRLLGKLLPPDPVWVSQVMRLTDPLWAHKNLEQLEKMGLMVSTTEVFNLIGVKPRGAEFTRGSWKFTKAGKIGRESGWRVVKIQDAGVEPT